MAEEEDDEEEEGGREEVVVSERDMKMEDQRMEMNEFDVEAEERGEREVLRKRKRNQGDSEKKTTEMNVL